MFRFLDLRIDLRLHRDGDITSLGLFLAGELVVILILISIAVGSA